MKRCSTCKKELPVSDFRRNRTAKDGLQNTCKVCHLRYCYAWKVKNAEKVSLQQKKHRIGHAEYFKCYKLEHKEQARKQAAKDRAANPGRYAAYAAKHRAAKLRATPVGLSDTQRSDILWFYDMASFFSVLMGEQYEVDHVIPLQGKDVCGLHVPWNLRVITAAENSSKGNRV